MKERNIVLYYVLTVVTLGIWGLVWYFQLNSDAKKLAKNNSWSPAISVVAVTIGGIIIIPPFVSVWKTWSRVRLATGAESGMSAGIQFCLCYIPVVSLAYTGYLQSKLNAAVRQADVVVTAPVATA